MNISEQIVISLGFGWVMLHILGNNRALGVVFGGICFFIAALLTLTDCVTIGKFAI